MEAPDCSTGHDDAVRVGPPSRGDLFPAEPGDTCPPWCVAGHGMHLGEDDWVHVGEPVALSDGVLARLCLSVDPVTGAQDGPYVVVGWSEYTLDEAAALGAALVAMSRAGGEATGPGAA